MKRLIFILFLSLAAISLNAQNLSDRIAFAATIGTGFSITKPSSTLFTLQFLGYYELSDKWYLGAGTGLSFYEKTLIPVFGDIRYRIGRERKFTPYAELAAGYSFSTTSDAKGGFFMNPSIGVRYPLKNNMKLQLAVGYELQKLERLKNHTDNYFYKEFSEKLSHNSISLKLGLCF